MIEPITLEGRYVRLEPIGLRHIAGLTAAATGPRDSFAFTEVPADSEAVTSYVEASLASQRSGTALVFAIIELTTGRVVGSTRFLRMEFWNWDVDSPHQRGGDPPDAVEIGATWLAEDVQRTGINTEAKLLMLTYAFETWQVHRVRLNTDARNQRSRSAIERLGARLDGVLRATRAAADGTIRDSAFYSILDSEWPDLKRRLSARLR